jgi:hypothetical protein
MSRALREHAEIVEPLTYTGGRSAARQRLTVSLRFGLLLRDFAFLMAKDPLPAPPFSPGFFARGQLSPLRNILAAIELRSITTDIENRRPSRSFALSCRE